MTSRQAELFKAKQEAWVRYQQAEADFLESLLVEDADRESAWVTQEEAAKLIRKSPATISKNVKDGLYDTRQPKGSKGVLIRRDSLFVESSSM